MYLRTNLDEETFRAVADITQFDALTQERLRDIIRQKAAEVQQRAITMAPKNTGRLASEIKLEFVNTEKTSAARVYTKNKVGHLVEFGAVATVSIPTHKKAMKPGGQGWFMAKAIIPRRAPHPFMQPAIDIVRPTIREAIKEAIVRDK